jgi:hypothetical protein
MEERNRTENQKAEDNMLEQALAALRQFLLNLAEQAGESQEYGEKLWQGIKASEGLLQEFSYYHDYGRFLCKYNVAGYTLADVLVWQVDHFKLYMDRPNEMNRYRQQRLLLAAFETLVGMEKDPAPYVEKMRGETGTDII